MIFIVLIAERRVDRPTRRTITNRNYAFFGIIQPRDKTPDHQAYLRPEYTDEAIRFYTFTVGAIDAALQQKARTGADGLVRVEYPEEKAVAAQTHINRELKSSLQTDPRQITAALFYGVLRPYSQVHGELAWTPRAQERLSGVIVSSTNETKREPPRLVTPLDPRWEDKTIPADVWEDLGDSLASAIAVAQVRFQQVPGFKATYPDMAGRMCAALDGDFRDFTPLYREVAELLEKSNTAIAMPVFKNEPFLEVLKKQVRDHPDSEWAKRQERYLSGPLLVTEQHAWLMGGNEFDSGLDGAVIYRMLPDAVCDHPKTQAILAPLVHSRLRIGSFTQDIIRLTGRGDDLYAFVVKQLTEALKQYIS